VELLDQMRVTGTDTTRTVTGQAGAVTTITCEPATGAATSVSIWNNRSGAHGTAAAALVITF
jgi:hypothetical protein